MSHALEIETNAAIPTWFGVGGTADRLAHPETTDQLRAALELDADLRVLGDGANLLVADEGVRELVVLLDRGEFREARPMDEQPVDGRTLVSAGAGVKLPQFINECVRLGLSGVEGLVGIPATIGGAAVMNAGGAFGEIGNAIHRVHALTRAGEAVTLERDELRFGYRRSGLPPLVITRVEFALAQDDPATCRERVKEGMAYKKRTQPLGDDSAGCCFKNPTLAHDVDSIGRAGDRVSAGMLIDRAGGKGLTRGGATISDRHANFVVTREGATAGDVLEVMRTARDLVKNTFGVTIDPEVVIWGATL